MTCIFGCACLTCKWTVFAGQPLALPGSAKDDEWKALIRRVWSEAWWKPDGISHKWGLWTVSTALMAIEIWMKLSAYEIKNNIPIPNFFRQNILFPKLILELEIPFAMSPLLELLL